MSHIYADLQATGYLRNGGDTIDGSAAATPEARHKHDLRSPATYVLPSMNAAKIKPEKFGYLGKSGYEVVGPLHTRVVGRTEKRLP